MTKLSLRPKLKLNLCNANSFIDGTKTLKKGLTLIISLAAGLLFVLAAVADEPRLGDVSDGSRTDSVHLIELYDEQGWEIFPDDSPLLPFSTKQTCGRCHSYEIISGGWHFNAYDTNVSAGRPGQPWIYANRELGMQVPLSYRDWPGAISPNDIGLSTFEFSRMFGRQMPGGGAGEIPSDKPDEIMRGLVSGKLEINCLSCHNTHPGQDQAEYAAQIKNENFRWAATGACDFAVVDGSAGQMSDMYDYLAPAGQQNRPRVNYDQKAFNYKNKVLFELEQDISPESCYFCHSNKLVGDHFAPQSKKDEDIHIEAGLTCVDCHRNEIGHHITRGYEGETQNSSNPLAGVSTCQGCHLGTEVSGCLPAVAGPLAGRLGAPIPTHRGIPPVHFEKLTCKIGRAHV